MVAEIPGKVSRIEPVSPEMVREQIEVLAGNFPIAAIKTGLLCSGEIISTVAQAIVDLRRQIGKVPLVVDPVIVATSGDPLLQMDAIEIYKSELFPLATLITPNLDEAERILGEPIPDLESMRERRPQARKTIRATHLAQRRPPQRRSRCRSFFADGRIIEFSAPFVRDVATHGTGCTYSAAITAGLASGLTLEDSQSAARKNL